MRATPDLQSARRHRWCWLFVFCIAGVLPLRAQFSPDRFTPLNTYSLGAEYSNDSSHIILGQAFNRRFAGLDLTYSRRVGRKSGIAYTWDIELRPLEFLQDPVATTTLTTQVTGEPTATLTTSEVPVQARCTSRSDATTFPVTTPVGTASGTFTVNQVCSTRWTYAGGLSPVGQRLNFWPRHALQPYLLANGGFLVSTRDLPANNSSRFNFTFTFGAGLEYFGPNGSAWSFDYRVQHLSNKNIGDTNPGVDSQAFRLSYSVARWHRRKY